MAALLSLVLLLVAGGARAAVLPESRVVNGQDAEPYSWPWQISLQYERDGTFRHTCGGTLIAANWVMTAAHCISKSRTYQVVLGEYDMSTGEGSEQRIPVNSDDIFVHPKWLSFCAACGNDIALMKLQRPAVLSAQVQVGRLPPAGSVLPNGYPCVLSGWGLLTTGGSTLPDRLQQAELPVVDYEHCTQPDWWGALAIRKTMICAGGAEKSGCNGDSGGPLNCQAEDGTWEVHGIASFVSALGCNAAKKPTVFTRVSAFEDWIAEVGTGKGILGCRGARGPVPMAVALLARPSPRNGRHRRVTGNKEPFHGVLAATGTLGPPNGAPRGHPPTPGLCSTPDSRCDPRGKFQLQGCISFMGSLSPCPRGPLLPRRWPWRCRPPRSPLAIAGPLLRARGRLGSPSS
ncbi:proproteinase E-like [Melozone crissalis]|uniref:proproteinase E-like n=1 Tax=Melozone crissalis TaxID=40204 RepID=UPI0023DA8B9D|nr:proproteinase E-like [Melozone crissalis]